MAVRHRLIRTTPQTVWEALADGRRHADWVVGTSSSEPVRGQWPQLGSAIRYETRTGPLRLAGETVVRRCERGEALELEAWEGPLGTARIAVRLRPWGNECLVTVDRHPLRGADGGLRRAAAKALIQIRYGAMLARLAKACEADAAEWERRRPLGQVVVPEPGRTGA
ncbi:SRPBCC family protein [Streptomyces sp. NPDC058632]|uniref:SRPBCC family protein n=1 Tax=unclassified Streptomyces TaxID=2593676 RepID=UPI00365DEFD2